MTQIIPREKSPAWQAAFNALKADNKSAIAIDQCLTFEENQGVYIIKKIQQKLGHFFIARFVEYVKHIDDTVVDLQVGKGVDLSSSTAVGEFKLHRKTDNYSSKKTNIAKLRKASEGCKQMIYAYLFDNVNTTKEGILFIGGTYLFSHFKIDHLYDQFMEEIIQIRKDLADAYREQFRRRYSAEFNT